MERKENIHASLLKAEGVAENVLTPVNRGACRKANAEREDTVPTREVNVRVEREVSWRKARLADILDSVEFGRNFWEESLYLDLLWLQYVMNTALG
jgi:hypothetical protein